MKWLNILIVLLVVGFVSLMFAAETQKEKVGENYIKPMDIETPELILNLSSDKEVYHSSEEMELKTTIQTETRVENLTIRVYGIKDRSGNYRVSGEKVVNVEPPGTSETFDFRMPSCYGCAGISPGEYEIIFETLKDGEIIGNFSKIVKLEK
ncbi:MAG: hypothetical protein KAW40_05565 [Candidatus Aenigmarchaeota archaeon]|nr:hypothetical protein [Candidatus Aenigmarchaeota archaeon]